MSERAKFWSDDFDMDLLKLIPTLPQIIGDVGSLVLYVHGHESFGRLNHPSVWNSDHGLIAFFGTNNPPPKPESYWTDSPIVECTFEEAIRDVWVHHLCMTVNRRTVWDSQRWDRQFNEIMYGDRGWQAIDPGRRTDLLRDITLDIADASVRMLEIAKASGVAA